MSLNNDFEIWDLWNSRDEGPVQ